MTANYGEPLRTTLARTGMIALAGGGVLAWWMGGQGPGWLTRWPAAVLLVLWFSFGGHWVEILFLNYLRPRLSPSPAVQMGVRVAVWFVGGSGLYLGMRLTALAWGGLRHWPAWWAGGIAFVGIELLLHLLLQVAGRPAFYNGQG